MPKVANSQILLFILIIKNLSLTTCQHENDTLPALEFPFPIATGEKKYPNPSHINDMMDTGQNQTRTMNSYRDISLHLTKPKPRIAKFSGQLTQCSILGTRRISTPQKVLDANFPKLASRKGINTTNPMVLRLEMPQTDRPNHYDKLFFP